MHVSIDNLPAVSIAETLEQDRSIVDLWYYFYEDINDSVLLSAHKALMTPDERERYGRFHFERDRRLFLATRALVRTVLSNYTDVEPAAWRFSIAEHGKPYISHPAINPCINFNLSNTPGLVVCAVSISHDCLGVDAEGIDRWNASSGVAEHYFSRDELKVLRTLPSLEQPRRFFAYWTLKESYIKARGLGLGLPLDQFSFIFNDGEIRVNFKSTCLGNATCWQFALIDAPPLHMIAIGVDTDGVPLSLRARQVVPLRGTG